MLLVILAAAAGFFGQGLLSGTSVGQDQQLKIEYERFLHYLSPTSLMFRIRATDSEQRDLRIRINSDFVQAMTLEKVVPEPTRVEAGDKWLSYNFAVNIPGEVIIKFDLTPQQIGLVSAKVSVGSAQPLSFWQFVYP